MKILIEHGTPFHLVHGGHQTQIEQTRAGLEAIGVEVEWLRWWDSAQHGDLIHAFGPVTRSVLEHAEEIGVPVVLTTLLTSECNVPVSRLYLKRLRDHLILSMPGTRQLARAVLPRQHFHLCTRNVVGLHAEQVVLEKGYAVPRDKIAVVPLGLADIFLQAPPATRTADHLITTGTITDRKRSIELAELAHRAEVPILFVGKPYAPDDPYWKRFASLIDGRWVRHQPHVESPAALVELLREARGFVIQSQIENWCFSAHEAAACGLPLLVPRMNWSVERFGEMATYFDDLDSPANVGILQRFHASAASQPAPEIRQWSWVEVAEQMVAVYEQAIAEVSGN